MKYPIRTAEFSTTMTTEEQIKVAPHKYATECVKLAGALRITLSSLAVALERPVILGYCREVSGMVEKLAEMRDILEKEAWEDDVE